MIDEHRGAFEFDWRTRLHLSLEAVGAEISWFEAVRLFRVLERDPSTAVGAAMAQFDRPTSREALVLMDLYDLQVMFRWADGGKKGPKPKPYPRPWPERRTKRAKPDASLTQEEIVAALRAAGHTAPIPERR